MPLSGPFKLNEIASTEQAFNSLPVPPTKPAPSCLPHPNPTKSFWTHSAPDANPLAKEGSTAELPKEVDVAIIGSGITGVGAAYHLSRLVKSGESKGITVAIFEARDFCSGATGRNGGHLTASAFHGFHEKSAQFGLDEAVKSLALEHKCASELVEIIKQNRWEDAVDLVHGGNVRLHFTEDEVHEDEVDLAAAKAAGVDCDGVEWLSEEETLKRYGAPFSSTRIEGHNVWPLKLVTKLYMLASASSYASWNPLSWLARPTSPHLSLSLYTHTPVESLSRSIGGVAGSSKPRWTLHTPRGNVSARFVIHATNAYVSHLLPQLMGPTGVVPTRGQVLSMRSAVPRPKLWSSGWSGNQGFEYWFPRPPVSDDKEKRPLIILGGGRESAGPQYEFYCTDDSEINPAVGATLREFLPAVYPSKFEKGKEPEMEWTGIMGFTQTYEPIVGKVLDARGKAVPGQYLSVGYSGHGMPRAFTCAEAVAHMVYAELQGKEIQIPAWVPKHYLSGFDTAA